MAGNRRGCAFPALLLVSFVFAAIPLATPAEVGPAPGLLPPEGQHRESPLGGLREVLVLKGVELGLGEKPSTAPGRLLLRAMARLDRSRGTLRQDLRAVARAFPLLERAFPGDPALAAAGGEALESLRLEIHGEQQWLLGWTERVLHYGERVRLQWGAARINELIVQSEGAAGMTEAASLLRKACRIVEWSMRGITVPPPRIEPPPFQGQAPDFLLVDKNPSSATWGTGVSPRDHREGIVAVFFMAST